jgi:uncharacterized protein YbjT (DUF2867 family)
MTIAITGATGQLGRIVINQLKDQVPAADLVALVRSPAKAEEFSTSLARMLGRPVLNIVFPKTRRIPAVLPYW